MVKIPWHVAVLISLGVMTIPFVLMMSYGIVTKRLDVGLLKDKFRRDGGQLILAVALFAALIMVLGPYTGWFD